MSRQPGLERLRAALARRLGGQPLLVDAPPPGLEAGRLALVHGGALEIGPRPEALTVLLEGRLPGSGEEVVLVAGGPEPAALEPPRVVAFVPVYNEADVLESCLRRLLDQGISPWVIDNWSTDGSFELAEELRGEGLAGLERWPVDGPLDHYHWSGILTRIEDLALRVEADWFVLHDADEWRQSPWRELDYRRGLARVQAMGYDAVDHEVLLFHPVAEDFLPGQDPVERLRHCEVDLRPGQRPQIKAWRPRGSRVALATSGGHQARFDGRRLFPIPFLLRHYPIRSQAHGERKVLRERRPRWHPGERRLGWHSHYQEVAEGHRFLRAPESLTELAPTTPAGDLVIEALCRAPIA